MIITIRRTNKTNDGIFGNLSLDTNSFKCVTLENLSLAIAVGSYPIVWMWSEHFGQIVPQIVVPNRTAIEIHWANVPSQLEGCIALGTETELNQDAISQSKIAWIGFIKAILNEPSLMLKLAEDFK